MTYRPTEDLLTRLVRERIGDEPSHDQCSDHEVIVLDDTWTALCCWYPTMGGYVSHAVVCASRGDGCVEVAVWHDGDFPFGGRDEWDGKPRSPVWLHHCSAEAFVGFGQMVSEFQDALAGSAPETVVPEP